MGLIDLYKLLIEQEKEVERLKLIGANSELPDSVTALRDLRERVIECGDDRFKCELSYLTRMVDTVVNGSSGIPKDELAAWKTVQGKYKLRSQKGLTALDPVE